MFTGIVSDVGRLVSVTERDAGVRLRIACAYDCGSIDLGASIACSGICLTVVETAETDVGCTFDVEASSETLACTTLGDWAAGRPVNLERALRAGDELGGHIVSGHVDGVATIIERDDEEDMARFTFQAPESLARYIAAKGSVALDGTSLTVNSVEDASFSVMLIPHSLLVTDWGTKRSGDRVNLEVDLFARYLERLDAFRENHR